jgi:glucosamine-6-phosphate deaminase
LHERLLSQVDLGTSHLIRGGAEDPKAECARLNRLIEDVEVDAAFVGIGENGHLAFNDPPADFEIEQPFITVELDDDGRKQQVDEGWFETLGDVPERAITMSISQVMAANEIICTVPHERKADAAKDCFKGPVSPEYPASILQEHDQVHVYLDEASASLLSDAE